MQVVLPLLLGDLVKTTCDYSVQPPVCTDDPTTSWVITTQFYTGLGLVQVGIYTGWGSTPGWDWSRWGSLDTGRLGLVSDRSVDIGHR